MGNSSDDRSELTFPDGRRVSREGNVTRLRGPASAAQAAENRRRGDDEVRQAEERLPKLVARLRQLLEEHDPVDVIGPLTMASLARPAQGPDVAVEHYGRQARMEYLMGLALSCESRGSAAPSSRVLGEAGEAVEKIFSLEETIHFDPPATGFSDPFSLARQRLRLEHLLDRDQGYLSHQEAMVRAVFAPIEGPCREAIGFSPATLPELVLACHRLAQRRIPGAVRSLHKEEHASPGPQLDAGYISVRPEPLRGIFVFTPQEVAETAGLDPEEVRQALLALSTGFGELPADLRPRDENRVRRFPVIQLGEDSFFLTFFWNPLDEFVPWFLDLVRARGEKKLEERFLRARDDAAERLTREALAGVFGEAAVLGPLHYEVDGVETELDCVVDAWPLALVVEVKAHRVTDAAWRGSPDRVRRLDADLGKARTQASRAARFLRQGGREFRGPRPAGRVELERSPQEVFQMAVSFEGVDPLTFPGGLDVDPSERIWNLSLPDLLMVAEVLDDPASFSAYLEARTHLAGIPNFISFMEIDLVGSFLIGRLIEQRQKPEDNPDAHVLLGYHGAALNEFFSKRDFGYSAEKPSGGVPPEVIDAVRWMMRGRDPEWYRVALAVMAAEPEAWQGWKKQLRRARRAGRGRGANASFSFHLAGGLELSFHAARGRDCFDRIEEMATEKPGALLIVERQGSPRQLRAASVPAAGP